MRVCTVGCAAAGRQRRSDAALLAAVALTGAAVGLEGLPMRRLAGGVAVSGRADARRGPAALARAAGVRSAACRAGTKELQGFDGINVALVGGGHHVDLRRVRILGKSEPAVPVALTEIKLGVADICDRGFLPPGRFFLGK